MPVLSQGPFEVIGARGSRPDLDLLRSGDASILLDHFAPTDVLHLAWPASSTPNYRQHASQRLWSSATAEFISEALRRDVQVHAVGSVAEVSPLDQTPYGLARSTLWRRLRGSVEVGDLSWLRIFYVFDPDSGHPELLRALKDSREPHADRVVLNQPSRVHDFIHIADVCSAIRMALIADSGGLYEVGSGQLRSVASVAVASGGNFEVSSNVGGQISTDPPADTRRLGDAGWTPRHTLDFFNDRKDRVLPQ